MNLREFKIENIGKQTDFKKGGIIKCAGKTIVKLDGNGNYVTDARDDFKLFPVERIVLGGKITLLRGYIEEDNK